MANRLSALRQYLQMLRSRGTESVRLDMFGTEPLLDLVAGRSLHGNLKTRQRHATPSASAFLLEGMRAASMGLFGYRHRLLATVSIGWNFGRPYKLLNPGMCSVNHGYRTFEVEVLLRQGSI